MDLKQHDSLYNRSGGGLSILTDDFIKSEPRLHSPMGGGGGVGGGSELPSGSSVALATAVGGAGALFCNIAPAGQPPNKRPRTDEWPLSSPSPGSHSLQSQTPAPAPLTPSPGPPSHPYTVISNGYSSPTMSSGSYDPYSPNGKLGKCCINPFSWFNFMMFTCAFFRGSREPSW